jgi:hypothetical protein
MGMQHIFHFKSQVSKSSCMPANTLGKPLSLIFIMVFIMLLGCHKSHSLHCSTGITGKWQLAARSGNGIDWQPVTTAERNTIDFGTNQAFSYADNNTNCTGTYQLDNGDVYINMPNCTTGIYFSQRIITQASAELVFRPNSGAILPYTRYVRVP